MEGRLVDLSCPIDRSTWRYGPEFPGFSSRRVTTLERDGFEIRRLSLPTHLGTHTDALGHLRPGGWGIGDVPISRYVGWARVVRLRDIGALEAIDAVRLSDAGTTIEPGEIALIATGWDRMLPDKDYPRVHPFLTLDAARWLIDGGVTLVAADLPGLMDPRIDLAPRRRPSHTVDDSLLEAGIPYVVGLINLVQLRSDRVWFSAPPLRLEGLDGSPVRAIAVDPGLERLAQ
jgi:kynurenine formamidase